MAKAAKRAIAWFDAIPPDEFFTRYGEAWSASDNVDHLIRAIRPVRLALKIPRSILQMIFGQVTRPSRTYDEICKFYETRIAEGGRASGIYLPRQKTPEHPKKEKKKLLERLEKAADSLHSELKQWEDADLDQYQLPHPLLGKLTVREMLFFSIYHTLRHARPEGD